MKTIEVGEKEKTMCLFNVNAKINLHVFVRTFITGAMGLAIWINIDIHHKVCVEANQAK